jgi:hypothetical protein
VIDRSLSLEEFGRDYLGGKSAKTAKRRVIADRIPYQLDHGHMLIRRSDAEAWREARIQTPAAVDLKSILRELSDRALTKVQQRSAS